MSWWCSGQAAVPWTWGPQPYIGIWIVMAGLAAGYLALCRRWASQPDSRAPSRSQMASFFAGWAVLWVATDWPIGALAAGYLLSASMLQITLYYYIAAPLLVLGVPLEMRERILDSRWGAPVRGIVRRPMLALLTLQLTLLVTHLPTIADPLKGLEVGMMLMDAVWLSTAILFWWSLDRYRLTDAKSRFGKRALYIVAASATPMVLGVVLTFNTFPIYTTYEFANRVWPTFTALQDQQLAGLLMWTGMTPLVLARLAWLFHEWYEDDRRSAGASPQRPEDAIVEG